MPVTDVDLFLVCDTRETISAATQGLAATGGAAVSHTAFSLRTRLSSTTTPDVEAVSYQVAALVAGAKTIDLTALPTTEGTYNATGKKVRAFMVKNRTGNAALTISEGATDGYALLGAGFSFRLAANQQAVFYLADAAPVVAAADKTIDLSGTGTQESEITFIIG